MNPIFSLSNIFSEFKYSIRLALPLIVSEIVYSSNAFIATIMIAHLGKEQLAANALVWEIYLVIMLFFIGILCSVGIMVAHSFGAKDDHSISICFKQGLIMACSFAPLMMLIMRFAPIILVWTNQDPIVINLAKPCFVSLSWAMLPLALLVTMHQFLTGINRARIVMFTSIMAVPIELFFFYAFLFGKFGLPKLGLAGIGYGLIVSYALVDVYLFCYLYFTGDLKIYRLFHRCWVINKKFLFELIRIGSPLGFTFCIEVALFAAVAMMMGILGTTVLAAYQIAYQYLMVGLVIIFALMENVAVRVGNEVGRNNKGGLQLAAIVNIGISFGFMLLLSIFYIGFPRLAVSLDIDIHAPHLQELVREAATFLSIVGVLILVDCVRLISAGALRGLKDTKTSMFISMFSFWGIAFPCAYLLAFKCKFGGVGIWWGVIIGIVISGIILFTRFNFLVNRLDLVKLVTKAKQTD